MARGEGSEKRSTTEAADQLRLFLPVLIQALSLQLLPLEFIPLLNLQISVEVGQLQRRKIQLREEEKRGRLTTSCMVTNDSPEETDLREETPEVGRTSRGPGCSRFRSRSRTRMSKGPLCTVWSPPALRPQAHPPASADTASSGSPGASAACARALGRQAGSPSSLGRHHVPREPWGISGLSTGPGETGRLALQPGPWAPVHTWAQGCRRTDAGLTRETSPCMCNLDEK